MLLPRLAWGTLQSTSDIRPTAWGLLAACQQQGIVAQRFHSQAYVDRKDPVHVASRALRFLDAWLHSTAEISLAFLDGMRGANLGFVTGTWDDASFRKLTELLALPRVAVLDVAKHPPCTLPNLDAFDGIWLQNLNSAAEALRWKTNLAAHTAVPVIGCQFRADLRCGSEHDLTSGLTGRELLDLAQRHWQPMVQWRELLEVASRTATFPTCEFPSATMDSAEALRLKERNSLRIAIAYDEAFSGYFPETLEALQQAGATLIDFSPLRNDCLPREIDLVYFGDGDLAPHLPRLAENHCLRHRLRAFVQAGGRVIVEGRAIPYFCRSATNEFGSLPMTGIFSTDAFASPDLSLQPREVTLGSPNWLGDAGTRLQGYQQREWRYSDEQDGVRIEDGVLAIPCSIPWHLKRDLFQRLFQPERISATTTR